MTETDFLEIKGEVSCRLECELLLGNLTTVAQEEKNYLLNSLTNER